MKAGIWACLILVTTLVGAGELAWAGGFFDLQDSWLLENRQVGPLLRPAPTAENHWWVSCSQGRLFGMPELDQRALATELRHRWWELRASRQWTGEGLYRETVQTARLMVGRQRSLGMAWRRATMVVQGEAGPSRGQWDLLARWSLARADWNLGMRLHVPLDRNPDLETRRSWLRLEWGQGPLALALALDRDRRQQPRLGVHGLCRLAPGVAWGFRFDQASGTMGPGLDWRRGGLLLRTSHLAHPRLGLTHRVQLNWVSP